MNIAVIGGTGATGKEIVRQALSAGHHVTVLARNPAKLAISDPKLAVMQGNVLNQSDVERLVEGADAVLCALGVSIQTRKPVLSEGTKVIVSAMKVRQVKRLVCITALGVGETLKEAPLVARLSYPFVLGHILADKATQERVIQDSDLDWLIVRPTIMTFGKARGRYRVGEHLPMGVLSLVSRADVAHFMLEQAAGGLSRKAVTISY